jgi:SAM-dependent methyltransferase
MQSDAHLFNRKDVQVRHLLTAGAPAGRLVDIGCGAGHLMRRAAHYGWTSFGSDISTPHIRFAREAYGFRTVVQADNEHSPFRSGVFDVAVLTAVIEHALYPGAMLRQAWDALRSGGRLLIQTDNVDSLSYLALKHRWPFFTPPFHLQNFSAVGLRALVEASGFRVLKCWTPHDIQASQLRGSLKLPIWMCRLMLGVFSPVSIVARQTGHGELLALTAVKD